MNRKKNHKFYDFYVIKFGQFYIIWQKIQNASVSADTKSNIFRSGCDLLRFNTIILNPGLIERLRQFVLIFLDFFGEIKRRIILLH